MTGIAPWLQVAVLDALQAADGAGLTARDLVDVVWPDPAKRPRAAEDSLRSALGKLRHNMAQAGTGLTITRNRAGRKSGLYRIEPAPALEGAGA